MRPALLCKAIRALALVAFLFALTVAVWHVGVWLWHTESAPWVWLGVLLPATWAGNRWSLRKEREHDRNQ